jgi:hypothetical protein
MSDKSPEVKEILKNGYTQKTAELIRESDKQQGFIPLPQFGDESADHYIWRTTP